MVMDEIFSVKSSLVFINLISRYNFQVRLHLFPRNALCDLQFIPEMSVFWAMIEFYI